MHVSFFPCPAHLILPDFFRFGEEYKF
jgi:hypothetical protein